MSRAGAEKMLSDNQPTSYRLRYIRIRFQLGLTLLEVLIALLVLSIGLLGVAVLTVQSLQNTHSAMYTSIASTAALDFEERLWLDLGRRASGCPDPNSAFPNAFAQHWSASSPNLGLPGLTVAFNANEILPARNVNAPDLRRVVLALTWNEERFGGTNETFIYETRVLCRD